MKLALLTSVLLILLAGVSAGETFSWVGERGDVVFTDNPASVPRKKGIRVRQRKDTAESLPRVQEKAATEELGGGARGTGQVAGGGTSEDDAREYGGKQLGVWRKDFSEARAEMKRLTGELDVVRAKIADPGHYTRSEYLAIDRHLRQLEVEAMKVRQRLVAMKKEAAAAGVPLMIRGE